MTFRKNKSIFFLIVTFFFVTAEVYASSRSIASLSLNFTRTESYSDQTRNSMTGKIIYNRNPYFFIFETEEPLYQLIYENTDGCFLLDGDTVIEISDQKEFIGQICQDFLNWFKEDYGLSASDFGPSSIWLQDGVTCSRWDYQKNDSHPIDNILVRSDPLGRLIRLDMYQQTEEQNLLLTTTSLNNFSYSAGSFYPTSITTLSYDQSELIMTTLLEFSNVSFNQKETSSHAYEGQSLSVLLQLLPDKDLSPLQKTENPQSPPQSSYKVSIPSVLANTGFKFYKKFITEQDMSACPFYPSCSQFMMDAISQNGVFGFFQGLERLKRCTSAEHKRDLYPTLSNGKHYDPVPPKKEKGSSK